MNQRKAGILLSYVNTALNGITMLVYVPMLLHYLTKEQYGVYQLMGSLIAALSLMDFGLGSCIVRFLAQARARQNVKEEQDILSAARLLYLLIAGAILVVGAGLYIGITPLYGKTLSPQELVCAKQIFIILLVNFALVIACNVFSVVMLARERFVAYQGIRVLDLVCSPLMVWGVLSWKADVLNIVWVQTFFNILVIGISYIYCRVKLQVHFPLYRVPGALIRKLAAFSLTIFIGNVSGQIYWRLGSWVLGAIAGAVAVANYYISSQICLFFLIFSSSIGSVFLPKLSADSAKSVSLQSHNEIFCRTGRLQALIACLILIGFVCLGREFLTLWLGPGNEVCYWPAVILMAGYMLSVIQGIAPTALQAMNRYSWFAYIYLASAGCNILLAFVLSKYYGVIGCALAAAFCLLVLQGLAVNIYYNRVGLDVRHFIREVAPIIISSVLVWLGLWGLGTVWPVQTSWTSFMLHGVVIVMVYVVVMCRFVLNPFEWTVLNECWQFITSFGRKGLTE